jgi:hypothetical protein
MVELFGRFCACSGDVKPQYISNIRDHLALSSFAALRMTCLNRLRLTRNSSYLKCIDVKPTAFVITIRFGYFIYCVYFEYMILFQ